MNNFNNLPDKIYLCQPVKGETTHQTVERNYRKYVEQKPKKDSDNIDKNNYAYNRKLEIRNQNDYDD